MGVSRTLVSIPAAVIFGHLAIIGAHAAEKIELASTLIFHVSFDGTCDANLSSGSGSIQTAETLARKRVRPKNHRDDVAIAPGAGRYGDALRFAGTSKQVLFYKGNETGFRERNWSGTISFWLKLDPNKDLPAGYCDPLLITEKKWNDAAFFVDFDKELPRDVRLGVFSDHQRWNPDNIPFEKIPVDKRPMVAVKQPPFASDSWTHVLFTYQNVNPTDASNGTAALYLNGELKGSLQQPMHFTWNASEAAIMIGIQYIGLFDDLAIFDRSLTADEIQFLRKLPHGARDIGAGRN